MSSHSYEFAWYRFRATFARRWAVYLNVILLIGLTGGLAMASVAAARRTQSSYPTFLKSTDPSTLTLAVFNNSNAEKGGRSLVPEIEGLKDVADVRWLSSATAVPLTPSGAPRLNTANNVVLAGSLDGYFVREDRLSVLQGHLSNPQSLNQIELTPGAARIWGYHVGEKVPIGFFAPSQMNLPGFGTSKVKPILTVRSTITAIVAMNGEIVQDDVDSAYGFAFLTPAMTKRAAAIDPGWTMPVYYAIQLRHGDVGIAGVESQLVKLVPPHHTYEFHVTSSVTSTSGYRRRKDANSPGRRYSPAVGTDPSLRRPCSAPTPWPAAWAPSSSRPSTRRA